jgi:hypothetical protein
MHRYSCGRSNGSYLDQSSAADQLCEVNLGAFKADLHHKYEHIAHNYVDASELAKRDHGVDVDESMAHPFIHWEVDPPIPAGQLLTNFEFFYYKWDLNMIKFSQGSPERRLGCASRSYRRRDSRHLPPNVGSPE